MGQDDDLVVRKRGRPRKIDAGMSEPMPAADCEAIIAECEAMAVPEKTHVTMKRNPEQYPAPHSANVHMDEVDNWKKHGWEHAD